MNYHPTPDHIVKIIKKHIPKNAQTVLEPAAGEGALLNALNLNLYEKGKITLIDIDRLKTKALTLLFPKAKVIEADFIAWNTKNKKYDLVITNPPFSGRVEDWVEVGGSSFPIEVAFIKKCLDTLNEKGFLIAIVPDSLINSDKHSNFRKTIFSNNDIKYCYQLPEKTFASVEGKFYLIIIKKGAETKKIIFRKLENSKFLEMEVEVDEVIRRNCRLDYDFHSTFMENKALDRFFISKFSGQKCFNFVSVCRGLNRSNYKSDQYIHSTSFVDGYWLPFLNLSGNLQMQNNYYIACKRVSRKAHMSFGLLPKSEYARCTDCIILIEPPNNLVLQTLFYLRVIFSNIYGENFLMRGSGAKFIPVNDVKKLSIVDISPFFNSHFDAYISAYFNFDTAECLKIEKLVFERLMWGRKVASIEDAKRRAEFLTDDNFEQVNFKA